MTHALAQLARVDPDGGLSAGALDTLKGFLTGSVAVAFFALVVGATAISMGYKWLRKTVNADRNSM